MNLNLLDPKLIALVAAVIVIIACPCCTCEPAGVQRKTYGKSLVRSTTARF